MPLDQRLRANRLGRPDEVINNEGEDARAASNLDPGDGNSSQDVFVGIEESVLYAIFSDGFE